MLSAKCRNFCSGIILLSKRGYSQIAKFMGPTWGPPGPIGPRWAPCWPHEQVDSPHKGPLIPKAFQYHDALMDLPCLHFQALPPVPVVWSYLQMARSLSPGHVTAPSMFGRCHRRPCSSETGNFRRWINFNPGMDK